MEDLTFIEGKFDEAEKEINTMICQLKEKDDDITKLKSESTSLKAQSCEATKMKEEMEIILSNKYEECKKMKEEIVFLKKEVDLLNKNLKSSQTLDDILSHQRSPLDKSGLGYAGESSRKNDANPNASNNKDVRKPGRNVDAPSSSEGKEKRQDNYGRNPPPRRNAYGVKDARSDGYHQRIPRQKEFRSTSRILSSPRYQSIFLGYCYFCTNFGHMAKDCRAYNKDKYNGPRQSPRSNFARRSHEFLFMNNIECFKCHKICHMARNCNFIWASSQARMMPENKVTQVWRRKKINSENLLNPLLAL